MWKTKKCEIDAILSVQHGSHILVHAGLSWYGFLKSKIQCHFRVQRAQKHHKRFLKILKISNPKPFPRVFKILMSYLCSATPKPPRSTFISILQCKIKDMYI